MDQQTDSNLAADRPTTREGRQLYDDFLNGPSGFGYAGITADDLLRGIRAIEDAARQQGRVEERDAWLAEGYHRSEPPHFVGDDCTEDDGGHFDFIGRVCAIAGDSAVAPGAEHGGDR